MFNAHALRKNFGKVDVECSKAIAALRQSETCEASSLHGDCLLHMLIIVHLGKVMSKDYFNTRYIGNSCGNVCFICIITWAKCMRKLLSQFAQWHL